ncbi:MAG: terminase large subunit, partial [Hyphomonadaceae bacterium]
MGGRSDRIIAFIELLKIPDGADAGRPFRLREWQKKIIRRIYDPIDKRTRRRLVRRVLLTMARKNAKTTLIAALVLVHLVGPESGPGQQIYSAANDREQAAIIYRAAEAMVLMDDDLSMLIRPVPSRKRLVCHFNGSFYQALSSDAKTKHGMNPAVWIYDELAQAPKRDLYDALDTSQGAQSEPLGIVISTQAREPLSLMSELVEDAKKVISGQVSDPTLAAFVFEVPPEADPFDEKLWPLANPALGDFLSLEDMRADAAKAKRLPSQLSRFRNLRLNQQVDGVDHIIGVEDWKACGMPIDRKGLVGRPCFGGLDLSAKFDLTALVLVFPPQTADELTQVLVRCWTPEHQLDERSHKDTRNPGTYRAWAEDGHLIVTPGRFVDYDYVAQEIAS